MIVIVRRGSCGLGLGIVGGGIVVLLSFMLGMLTACAAVIHGSVLNELFAEARISADDLDVDGLEPGDR